MKNLRKNVEEDKSETAEQFYDSQPVEFATNVNATVALATEEKIIGEEIKPCKKEFDFVGSAKGIFNVADGELVTVIPVASGDGLSINYDIMQIFKKDSPNFNCGKNMRLNLHEKIGRAHV